MQSAADALSRADPLAVLQLIGHRHEPIALALRGMAMAQMHEYDSARQLLTKAIEGFDPGGAPLSRARAVAALAEISVAERDVIRAATALEEASTVLSRLGDRSNAVWVRLIQARLCALTGGLDEARRALAGAAGDVDGATDLVRTAWHLATAELFTRCFDPRRARVEYERASALAVASGHRPMMREAQAGLDALAVPLARIGCRGIAEELSALELAERFATSDAVIIDGIRRQVHLADVSVDLSRRPVLFDLVFVLGKSAPEPVDAATLLSQVFGAKRANESLRERLRVELSRLRQQLAELCDISATGSGEWRLSSRAASNVVTVESIAAAKYAPLLALLSDGELWSAKALSHALDCSQRTVQRQLTELVDAGSVEPFGKARRRRYSMPLRSGALAGQMLTLGLLLPASRA